MSLATAASRLDPRRLPHDLTWRLLRDGYDGIAVERKSRGGADPFVSTMLGGRAVVVSGSAGVRLFYDESVVERGSAIPPPLGWLLFGRGAVHSLDDEEHKARKRLFLELLAPDRVQPVVDGVRNRLGERAPRWAAGVAVFDELVEVYGDAILAWSGIRVDEADSRRISGMLAAVVDGFGLAGLSYPRAWAARLRLNRWAAELVGGVRRGEVLTPADRPLGVIAARADLDDRTAGVELLNILRPTVAVAWPATMAIAHLLRLPEPQRATTDEVLTPYVHECRRLQPFAPALAGRVRRQTSFEGVVLRPGDRIVLDIVGTHLDPRTWGGADHAAAFDPARFAAGGDPDPYTLVPQGGDDPARGHRCPGEPLTVRLLETTLREVASQGLRVVAAGEVDRRRIPTRPDPPVRVARDARGPGHTPNADPGAGYRSLVGRRPTDIDGDAGAPR
ncbi:MAG TPA: cytochrome P450 [Nocardioides sp.]|nr:cytochrome P450 [Nocardioides sp.]